MRGSGIWRAVLVVAVVFAAVWACVIAWWRRGGATPDAVGILVWLVLVPVAILSSLWIVARVRRRRQAMAEAVEDSPAPDAPGSGEPSNPQSPLGILAAAASLGCGGDVRALSRSLGELPRPRLHPTLRDRDGLPVLAAFSAELDTGTAQARLRPGSGPKPAEEHVRALALLEPVAIELLEAAARLLPPLPGVEARVIAGLRRSVAEKPRESGSVHVVVMLPQDIPRALREDCGAWLHELAAECGLDPRRSSFEVVVEQDAQGVWQRIGRLLGGEPKDGADWQLLLAAGSSIGERGLHALAAGGRLAGNGNPEGLVPGEGAAGLLLRPDGGVRPAGQEQAPVLAGVHSCAFDPGAPARRAARDSGELLAAAMQSGAVKREDISTVLTDADQRPSRSVEAAVAASAACPGLDPVAEICALGVASGHLGHVAPLALLAIATERTRETAAPVLALSVGSSSARAAALLRPTTAEALSGPSQPPANETGAAPGVPA